MRRSARVGSMLGVVTLLLAANPVLAGSPIVAAEAPNNWLIIVASVAVGLGAFLLLIVLFGGGSRSQRNAEISGRLRAYGDGGSQKTGLFGRFRFLKRAAARADAMAESQGNARMIATALEQANIPIRPGEAIVGTIGMAFIGALIIGLFTRSFVWAVVAFAVALILPLLYVLNAASSERKKFDNQLPDTLNLLATSLRAGYSLLQAVEAVSRESAEPTRREFGRAMTEIRLGRPMAEALGDVATRMESQDFEWAVLAIAIQREVGGNLAEVLQTTAEMILQRNRLRREMKALTAEGRISAVVVGLMPFFLFGMLWVLNPAYLAPLYTTLVGGVMMAVGLILMVFGMIWMQKIVRIEV